MIRIRRPLFAALAAALLAVALPAAPASAASRDGWVRLAHMSPDTAAVNITLSSLSGDVTLFRLQNVGYGAVSKYMRLPQGTYALAMVPAGENDPNATPVVSGSVKITAGKAETLAAIGKNDDLKTTVFTDDLNTVSGDDARVRIVQASVTHKTVDAKAGSTTVASDASFGDVSKYATVKAGSTAIDLSAGSDTQTVTQQFAAGSAHTLFVIDDSKGDLTVSPALDSAAATETPVGSLAAGGGGLADGTSEVALVLAAMAAAGGAIAFGAMARRRREVLGS
ncbi:DUF4397 domain-containing protein [Amnibacterium kyonggiense]|uniref:Uncharacterized protein DUF4397 n=1 Tax=Amnibacterium kyonggiense TaxID=595671 RepID=A0A4R7FT29_9MICO|nr:DUF4397 domain-containing protein [Amnibacterium kyonggiense]TDS81023.1 uncharacterized protein DUF4397 [Amnibacterium kyonggiense]